MRGRVLVAVSVAGLVAALLLAWALSERGAAPGELVIEQEAGPDGVSDGPALVGGAPAGRSRPVATPPLLPLEAPPAEADHYVAFGRVVDTRGRPIDGGEVVISRLKPAEYEVRRAGGGRFELRMPKILGTSGAFSWRGEDGRSSQMIWPPWKHSAVAGPFELVAREPSQLTVRATLPDGSPAAGGTIYITGAVHGHRVPRQLDGSGEVTWDAPPLHMWVEARSKDERHRVTKGVRPPEDEPHLVELSLIGPWVPIEVVVTSRERELAGEEVRIALSHGPCRSSAKALVDDAPVELWVPPPVPGEVASISVSGRSVVSQHLQNNWKKALPGIERSGLRLRVAPRSELTVCLIHRDGRPLNHLQVAVGNHHYVTDEQGRFSARLPFGQTILRHQDGTEIGRIDVTQREQTSELAVQGLQEIGGPYDGPTPHNPFLGAVTVKTEDGRKFRGEVLEQEKRWHAWVRAPAGAPVALTVEAMLENWAEPASGSVGDLDVPLTVRAGWLRVRPVVGSHRAPVGHLRVTGVDVEYGTNVQIAPSSPIAHLRPIKFGTYRFAWSNDGGKTWHESGQRVEVGKDPVEVEARFPASR